MESAPRSAVWSLYAAIIAFTFLMLLFSIPAGTYAVFFTTLSATYTPQTLIQYFPVYIGLVQVNIPVNPSFGALFLSLTVLYSFFFAAASLQGVGVRRAISDSTREGVRALMRNPMTGMIVVMGATLLATVMLDYFQTSAGVQTGGLTGDPFDLLINFTLAPLIEEVGYRFFLIGVPLALILLATRPSARKFLLTLWRPSAAWEPAKMPDELAPPTDTLKHFTYFLIALSSVLFGLAHYLSGAGWDIGKVSEAALDGAALAYVYMRYGLHVSILFHWVVDYASNAYAFLAQGLYGVNWTTNSVYSAVPSIDIVLLVGLPALLYFVNLFFMRVIKPKQLPTADDSSRQINPD